MRNWRADSYRITGAEEPMNERVEAEPAAVVRSGAAAL